jgi:hypothetical protein
MSSFFIKLASFWEKPISLWKLFEERKEESERVRDEVEVGSS